MKKVYLAHYDDEDGKASIAKANIVKETDLTITFNFDYENLIGWIYINNRPMRRKTLRNDGVEIFDSLKECFVYLQSMAQNRFRKLNKDLSETERQMKVFGDAVKADKDIEELIKQERKKE